MASKTEVVALKFRPLSEEKERVVETDLYHSELNPELFQILASKCMATLANRYVQ